MTKTTTNRCENSGKNWEENSSRDPKQGPGASDYRICNSCGKLVAHGWGKRRELMNTHKAASA